MLVVLGKFKSGFVVFLFFFFVTIGKEPHPSPSGMFILGSTFDEHCQGFHKNITGSIQKGGQMLKLQNKNI